MLFYYICTPLLLVLSSLFYVTAVNDIYLQVSDFTSLLFVILLSYLGVLGIALLVLKSVFSTSKILLYMSVAWLLFPLITSTLDILFDENSGFIGVGLYIYVCAIFIMYFKRLPFADWVVKIIFVFGVVFISMQIPSIYFILSEGNITFKFDDIEKKLEDVESETKPHIIYIVPDRYPSNYNLSNNFSFDNTEFSRQLRMRNFYVWDKQYANYTKTFQSLGAVFNMDYLTPMIDKIGKDGRNYTPIYNVMANSQALRIIVKHDYQFINMGSWWMGTSDNALATLNVSNESPFSEFTQTYLSLTPMAFLKVIVKNTETSQYKCDLVEKQANIVVDVVKQDKPSYIFWHLVTTHVPFIYNEDGSCNDKVEWASRNWEQRKSYIVSHVKHTNKILLDVFDKVQKASKRPVIFVIQSDEGPYFWDSIIEDNRYNFWNASDKELDTKYGMFNAMYFSSGNYKSFDDQKSPINNFRLIFNEIFNTDIPLLEHRHYLLKTQISPYNLKDITDRLRPASK